MRIAYVTSSITRRAGGLLDAVRRPALELARHEDVQIDVLALDEDLVSADGPLWRPVTPRVFPSKYIRAFGYAPGIYAMLDQLKPDVVHSHGLWMYPGIAASNWCRKNGCPHIVSPHGMLEPWSLARSAAKKRLVWALFEKRRVSGATILHATAKEEADHLRALNLANPIAVLPCGVDQPPAELPPPVQKETRTALFLSRIHPKKGLMNLIAAWKQVRPAGWRMVVAGPDEGGHEREVQAAVHEAGLDDCFDFPGPVYGDDKWKIYQQADLFVLPTFSENFGIVIAEALATGVPVITTKGTPWSVLETNGCGWWVDVGVEPLAAALRDATSLSTDERRAMGLRGRRYVEENCGWPRIADETLAVYRWALQQGPRPECVRIGP